MRNTSQAAVLLAGALAASGCNLLFGIEPGTTGVGGSGGSSTGGAGGSAPTCPPTKPASCEPAATTPESCCVTGRSCGEAECVAGECAAERILPALDPGHNSDCVSIAVAGDHLFFTTGGNRGLVRTSVDGTGKVDINVPDPVGMMAVARVAADPEPSPQRVYFTDYYGTTIGTVPAEGGAVKPLATVPVAGEQARYGNILVHGEFVYWAMHVEDEMAPGRDVWRAKRTGEGAVAEKVVDVVRPLALAADDDYLYVADSDANTLGRVPWSALGEGASLPVAAETLVTDAATDPGIYAGIGEIAVDDEYIYWGSDKTVWTASKKTPGAERSSIGTGNSLIGVILADGRDVYFSTLGDTGAPSQVIRVAKGGVTKTQRTMFETYVLPDGRGAQISSIAHDCDHVYVLVRPDCEVHRFTK